MLVIHNIAVQHSYTTGLFDALISVRQTKGFQRLSISMCLHFYNSFFLFLKTGFLSVALAVLELKSVDQAALNS